MKITKNKQYTFSLSFSLVLLLLATAASVVCSHAYNTADTKFIRTTCNGTIAECEAENSEFEMDSEIHHRLLQQSGRKIDYGALDPDRAACDSGNGKAYSDCTPRRNGNPPSRGCRAYEKCRVN
ncbi:Rapid ALkalinization Factor protein [Dioscorea alata]|uniref:Rapid ALkalinization Factor protein n=1 Tax=Dioscorea alata TaxID=55571 RepID=A0ACB7W6M5_DIOAL|nr:Rapid ALkalinization Factor protein [Dioscorea alata]